MQKFILNLLLFAGVVMAIPACSKKKTPAPDNLVGKWSIVSDTVKMYDTKNNLVDSNIVNIPSTDYVQFNSNGSGIEHASDADVDFNYTFNNNIIHLVYKTVVPADTLIVKHLDAHTLYTENVLYVNPEPGVYKENIFMHYTK